MLCGGRASPACTLIPAEQVAAQGRQRPERPPTVISCRGDLDPRAAIGGQRHDHGIAPDPLDLTRLGRARLPGKPVHRHHLVAEQRWRLGPDKHVADPAAIASVPFDRRIPLARIAS